MTSQGKSSVKLGLFAKGLISKEMIRELLLEMKYLQDFSALLAPNGSERSNKTYRKYVEFLQKNLKSLMNEFPAQKTNPIDFYNAIDNWKFLNMLRKPDAHDLVRVEYDGVIANTVKEELVRGFEVSPPENHKVEAKSFKNGDTVVNIIEVIDARARKVAVTTPNKKDVPVGSPLAAGLDKVSILSPGAGKKEKKKKNTTSMDTSENTFDMNVDEEEEENSDMEAQIEEDRTIELALLAGQASGVSLPRLRPPTTPIPVSSTSGTNPPAAKKPAKKYFNGGPEPCDFLDMDLERKEGGFKSMNTDQKNGFCDFLIQRLKYIDSDPMAKEAEKLEEIESWFKNVST